jgi:hypothetical protein
MKISSQLANNFDYCSAESFYFKLYLRALGALRQVSGQVLGGEISGNLRKPRNPLRIVESLFWD